MINKENLSLVIFDMDGVIINSEPLHRMAFEQIKNELSKGTEVDVEDTAGASAVEVYQNLLKACPPCALTPEEVASRHFEFVWQNIRDTALASGMDGLPSLLQLIDRKGCSYAVASSSPRSFVESCLTSVNMLTNAKAVICGDSGFPVKPEPDMFLAALKAAGVPPQQAVIIEDSRLGTIAAQKAGIRCIGINNPDSGAQDLFAAGWIVENLYQAAEIIKSL